MDSSIRLYNSNSRLRPALDAEHAGHSTAPALDEQDSRVETAAVDEEERGTDTISRQSVDALQEQAKRVDVAGFEGIFLRFQGPITNFLYHLIGKREQASDLRQDVFGK